MFIRTLLGSAATEYQNNVNLTLTPTFCFNTGLMSTIFSLWLAAKTVELCSVTVLLCDASMTIEQQGTRPGSLHCNNHCFLNQVSAVVWPTALMVVLPSHLLLSPSASVL